MVLLITCPAFISMHTSITMKNKRKSQFLMEIIYNDEKRNSKTEFKLHDEDDGFFVKIKIKNRLPPSWQMMLTSKNLMLLIHVMA
jgi:hypothetical protein